MSINHFFATGIIISAIVLGNVAVWATQEKEGPRKIRKVRRVKRPTFEPKDWDGIFFDNLFSQGLSGERPAVSEGKPQPRSMASNQGAESNNVESGSGWSRYISRDAIEDEVKSLQQELAKEITTPTRFKSNYEASHQAYSMLAMLFSIIHEYDSEVRWKENAAVAQPSFARAAANSRVGTIQAYQNAKLQRDNLTELVRGGNFNSSEPAVESIEWPAAVRRSPVMERLQVARDILKTSTANKTEYVNNKDQVVHEANLIAAMGQVLLKEDMEGFDEDSYVSYANEMTTAASKLVQAATADDFDSVSNQANLIDQSCSNCHDEWR